MVAEVRAVTYKPLWFQDRRLVLGTLAVIFLSLLMYSRLGYPAALSVVLAFQIVLFFSLFQRPVWALASLIVGQLTTNNLQIPVGGQAISIRFIWTALALLLLVPILKSQGGIKLGSQARRVIVPAVIYFIWATITAVINTDMSFVLQDLRMTITAILLLVLLPAAVKNEQDLKRLSLVVLVTCSISAIFALQQHYDFLGLPRYSLYGLYDGSESDYRVQGLSESAVQLGFNLPVVILPVLAFYFMKVTDSRNRKLILFLVVIMTIALYFTLTRTGIYALAPGLLLMALLMKGKVKKTLLVVLLLVSAAFLVFVNTQGNRYSQGFGDDSSATGRLVLWQAGLKVAMDNPILGVGASNFRAASSAYASTIDATLMKHKTGAGRALGVYDAHNDFIGVWAASGIVALVAYLWLFIAVFRNFLDGYRHSRTRFLKALAIGCIGAFIAYIVNAATHNMMATSQLIWLLCAFSIAINKVVLSRQLPEVSEVR
jgi:O-antigen ligase